MAQKLYRQQTMTATTGAVSWTIRFRDDADVKRVYLAFASAPSTSENVDITIDSQYGPSYDALIRSMDAQNCADITHENIDGIENGDALLIEYPNTDGISVTGVVTYSIIN